MNSKAMYQIISPIVCTALVSGSVFADGDAAMATARFARDLYASRASILIIGDSTNTPQGAGAFVPYYEGFLQTLPEEVELCGFRVSGSTGGISVNSYISFSGGSTSELFEGGIGFFAPNDLVGFTGHAPPGYREELRIVPGGALPSIGQFASVGLVNLSGIYPNAEQWGQGATLVLRTPFFIASDQTMLPSISMRLLNDHDGSAGTWVGGFDAGVGIDINFENDRFGLQMVDAVFVNPPTTRIGVRFSGDLDDDDGDEPWKMVAWCDHILFDQNRAQLDRGVYFDSISIGGFTAKDHVLTLDPLILDDYFAAAPRPYSTILIWLGQNAGIDEWNGTLLPAWGERIESIAEIAIQASIDAGGQVIPVPVLVTPPLADGDFPNVRFSAMNNALAEIANRRGWGHIDLHSLVGNSLTNIDPAFDGPGPHPSQEATLYLTSLMYDQLNCLRADYTGDGVRNFFDVSAFLSLLADQSSDADLNGDGNYNFFDISVFLEAFTTQCP